MSTRESEISPAVLALRPPDDNGAIETVGQKLLLGRAGGLSNLELSAIHGVDEDSVEDLIAAAVDNNIMAEMHQQIRDRQVLKLMYLDQQAAQIFNDLKSLELPDKPGVIELRSQKLDNTGAIKDLKEDFLIGPMKIGVIKERRQISLGIKTFLAADTGERSGDENRSELNTILSAAKDTMSEVMRELAPRIIQPLVEEAREVGRLQEQQANRTIVIETQLEPVSEQGEP